MATKENDPKFYKDLEERGERRSLNMIVDPHEGYQTRHLYRDYDPLSDGIDDKMFDGSNIINPGLRSGMGSGLPCLMCNLTNVGPVQFVCNEYAIIKCPICKLDLVVFCAHSMSISVDVLNGLMKRLESMFPGFELYRESEYNHLNYHVITKDDDRDIIKEWHIKRRGFEERR